MNNRTLWTIVGVVLLVVIALLVFGVISIPVSEVAQTSTSTSTSTAAASLAPSFFGAMKAVPAHAFLA